MPPGILDDETVSLAGFLLSLVIGTFVHEGGHVLGALSVGQRPRLVSLGRGAPLARVRIGPAWWVLRALPIGGYVHCDFGPDTTARQRFVTTAGGPAATLLVAAAPAWALLRPSGAGMALLLGWIVGQGVILAGSAVPAERRTPAHVSVSDGLRLLRIARGEHRGAFARLHAAFLRRHLPEGAAPPPPSRHMAEIVFQRTRRDRRTEAWAQDDAAASLRALLAYDDLPDGERAVAQELLDLCESHAHVRAGLAELAALQRGELG